MFNSQPDIPVVIDTSRSQFARLKSVPLTSVSLEDSFWAPRLELLRETTLPTQYQLLEETGRIDNFRRAAGIVDAEFQGFFFNDSDVYKWVEAVAWSLAGGSDPKLEAMLENVIAAIEGAQEANGYLNSYFTFERKAERWRDLENMHELYCAGHLIQAAIAHYRSTGSDRLLNIAVRNAYLISEVFGLGDGKRVGTGGHPEIEMALVELARTTGNDIYLEKAQFFLDVRGQGLIGGQPYHQDHRPFRELDQVEGHAVRAVYLNAGGTDLYSETGERAIMEALERMWENMVFRRSYISGGLGSRHRGEAFGEDYELPNERAYAETCAAIASVMWNWRMLTTDGQARFSDVLENTLYNAFLVGLGLDGKSYSYHNPLAAQGDFQRQPWFSCACCPTNIPRMLGSLPGYIFSISNEGIWVHLYAKCKSSLQLLDGRTIPLQVHTRYPWDGRITLEVQGEGSFSLFMRIPRWSQGNVTLEVNGDDVLEDTAAGRYAQITRDWKKGDVVQLELPMPVRMMESHPYVLENSGKVAIMRGPILYCVEGVDHPGIDLRDLILPEDASFETYSRSDFLGGVVVLQTEGGLGEQGGRWKDELYYGISPPGKNNSIRSVPVTAVPYYAWGNREPGQMRVWVSVDSSQISGTRNQLIRQ
ncbi:MAG: glycoside hydrolase family 127 protein [Anaerolineales bacterium]|nr:glycoside hydrolase family 127 protein [Anaerolineales bacterium]